MKIKLLYILVALPVFLLTNITSAQTTLAAGDIAIFQNQADNPDDFAFVTFVDIDATTGIYFTDCGSTTSGFVACTEGAFKYVVPTGGLDAGDIVRFSTSGSDFSTYTDALITGSASFATSGDQIIAFQDNTSDTGGANASATPRFLFAINNASTLFTGNPPDSNETNLPPGLSDTGLPRTALGVGAGTGVDVEHDNTIYNGTYDFSGFATEAEAIDAAKIAMTDPSNYINTNINPPGSAAYASAVTAIPTELNLMTLSNDEFLSNSFAVYPNPSNGNITIRNSGVALQNVTITDLNGRTMGTYEMNGVTTNTDLSLKLNTGMYFMRLTSTDNASTTKKLIIK